MRETQVELPRRLNFFERSCCLGWAWSYPMTECDWEYRSGSCDDSKLLMMVLTQQPSLAPLAIETIPFGRGARHPPSVCIT